MKKSGEKFVRGRRATAADAEVGQRVRARRLECQLSQTELADKIGVTFQQVQKYEKGVNRIGAGRLQRISEALQMPVSFFFGAPKHFENGADPKDAAYGQSESVFALLQSSGAVRVVKAFHAIKSQKSRQLLVQMAENMASPAAA